MTRLARAGLGVLVVLVLFLLGTAVREVGELNAKLGRAQGQVFEQNRQIEARDAALASAQRRLDAATEQRGQLVQVIVTLTRQLTAAGITPAATQRDVPTPMPGPTATPSTGPSRSRATPSPPPTRPRPRATATARPRPSPAPSCRVPTVPLLGCMAPSTP